MKNPLGDLMKQARDMQASMQQMQQELASMEIVGEAGAGLVKVTMNGKHDVTRVNIDASLLREDVEVLEDLVAAAVNDCVRRVETAHKEKMGSLTGGLTIPGLFPQS